MEDSNLIAGLLFKRRGGFGKMMLHNWQQRYFIVTREGLLFYYDTDSPDAVKNIADTKPRGKLNLKGSHLEVPGTDTVVEPGAPTAFLLQLVPAGGEERWKLCASNREEHQKWIKVFEKFTDLRTYRAGSLINSYASDDEMTPRKPLYPEPVKVTPSKAPTIAAKPTKGRLKLKVQQSSVASDLVELILTLFVMNFCIYMAVGSKQVILAFLYIGIANFVVGVTLYHRSCRATGTGADATAAESPSADATADDNLAQKLLEDSATVRPPPGGTYQEVTTPQKSSPSHTWSRCDSKLVTISPSSPPCYHLRLFHALSTSTSSKSGSAPSIAGTRRRHPVLLLFSSPLRWTYSGEWCSCLSFPC